MKKTLEHGKIWLIAAFISFASFVYLQADQHQQELERTAQVSVEEIQKDSDNTEFPTLDADIVKGISLALVKFMFVE
jgi:hypothetical protein